VTDVPADNATVPANGDGAAMAGGRADPALTPAAPEPPVFGRLESVQLRKYWRDEARDFTPWLAREENLTLLGEAIG
jgi:hypothetical protein